MNIRREASEQGFSPTIQSDKLTLAGEDGLPNQTVIEADGVSEVKEMKSSGGTTRPTVILHTDNPGPAIAFMLERHPDISIHGCDSYASLPGLIEATDAEVVYSVRFDGTPRFPRTALVESPTVKWVSVGGSGTDHLQPWNTSKVTVTNAAGVAADMMAEYALGAMLSFSLDLRGFERRQRAAEWFTGKVEPIEGCTVLILGLGNTGFAVARRAKAMGMTTLGVDARLSPLPNVDQVHSLHELPSLWGTADFVVCCLPLVDSTRGLVGQAAFAAMRRSAVLIDVSRGGIVDHDALLAALDGHAIKGAALDVFPIEPLPAKHSLWSYENVLITPHCSAVYDGWEIKALRMFSDNLSRYQRGEALENIVEPSRGY